MADVFFKCGGCGKNLVVEETGVGQEYECLHCRQPVRVPAPTDQVACAGCGLVLKIPPGMDGESVKCPGCRAPVRVPGLRHAEVAPATQAGERPRLKLRSEPGVAAPPPPSESGAPVSGQCPSCHAPVAAEAVICVQCGLNLKTGKKMTTATSSASRLAAREAKEAKAKLIKNIVLTVVAVGIFAFAIPRIWRTVFGEPRVQSQPPVPRPTAAAPAATAPTAAAPAAPAAGQPPGPMPGMPPGMPMPPGMMMPPGAPGATNPPVAGLPPSAVPPARAGPVPPGPMLPPMPMPPGQTGPVPPLAIMPGYPVPPGMPLPPGMTAAPPAAVAATVPAPPPPPPPPKPPPVLLTAEDLQQLGPLEKLTVAGVTYTNVRWTRVSPSEAFFFHSGGAASVPIVKLLPALKEQHHFEPPKHE